MLKVPVGSSIADRSYSGGIARANTLPTLNYPGEIWLEYRMLYVRYRELPIHATDVVFV